MMKLFLKLLRDMKQSLGQFIAFVLIIAVGAFFYTGLVTLSDNLTTYSKQYFKEHHLSDLNVYYNQISPHDIASLSKIDGITKIEGRYSFDATQAFDGYKTSLKLHSIPIENEINTPAIIEGSIPSQKDHILLDSHYAKEHNYQVGDKISLSMDKNITFEISGLAENVKYAKKNDTQDHFNFGFAYIAEDAISELADSFYYNEIMIDAEDGYDIDQLGQAIERQSQSLTYASQSSKERSFNYTQMTQTIYNNKLMSTVIPFVLFIIEAIILFLTMNRIIDSERNQVGIMKALGIKNRSIMLHYMGYPVLSGVLGSIIGYVITAIVFIPLVTTSIARSYSLPDITFSLSLFSIIPPIIFSSAFGILACYLSGRTILQERAAQAMRPKPPKKAKMLWIERIPGVWNRISYNYKLILRNIILNKQKVLASSIGVVVSTILLVTAFGTQSALLKVVSQIEDVYSYDLRVDYTTGVNTLNLPSGINNSYHLSTIPIEFVKENEKENATLVVTERENNLIHFYDEDSNGINLEDNGVLVPKSYADKYNISAGDNIEIKFVAPQYNNKTVDMKVLHVSTQYSNPSFYMTDTYLKSFNIDYTPSSLLVEINPSTDPVSIRNFFEQDHRVDVIADKSDLKKTAEYTLKQNNFVFVMFIICAVVLSFGAIYTISSINIYERNRELATLKVLGYQKNKINRLIFFENMIITTFAVIVALPISGYVYSIVVNALSSSHQQIPSELNSIVIVVSAIVAYLLTILSSLLLRTKVTNINMMESLKSVE